MRSLLLRGLIVMFGLAIVWQCCVYVFSLPPYILPTPLDVMTTGYQNINLLFHEAIPTICETVLGLLLGTLFGCMTALFMTFFNPVRYWLMPILIISQAIPTFAIAPLLVIWFGYGMTAKIITTMIMLFFPITSAFYDGLRNSEAQWHDLAKTLNAKKWRYFIYIRIPAALPSLATGLRVAAVIAPIGAVVGEWVGASQGLGFLMLNANARMQIDLMFAGLFVLVLFSLTLYFVLDRVLKILIPWQMKSA